MPRKSRAQPDDFTAVEELMQDLEARLHRLTNKAKSDETPAADDIADFVSQTLARIAAQVRDTADDATDRLAGKATEASTDIIRKVWDEMQRRPLVTLALVAGAGYLLGLVSRQDDAE